ncbi:alkylation response protein AidB-like acyl-CoA dehydrogenase [Polaromonas sp. CG_9.5]|uniref:acyl-CoA dehydrogenase family protein n=1 Tax=Polaromonas sp. CG_9.5 TaxID=3071705 RepID=UPI002DFC9484|nr:alkylation response protein AidB-like acyl-CoA dehydrogenase [Polaromonas sp. CG_9.5]
MDLSLSDEQQQIADSAATFLQEASAMPAVRAASESASGLDSELWRGIAELGWGGVHLPESAGGLGLGMVELVLLQEQLGRQLACVPFFDSVALAATVLRELPGSALAQDWLESLATGEKVGALALTAEAASPVAAVHVRAQRTDTGWTLDGEWPQVGSAALADVLLLPAQGESGESLLFAVPAGATGLQVQPLKTLDTTRRLAQVQCRAVNLPVENCIGQGESLDAVLARTLQLGAIALAAEQVGVAQQCLDLTLAYAAQRVQFDKPIAGFQAVKHRCAQMLVALESARSAVYGAACIADTTPDAATLLFHAAQARVAATEAAQFCAREAIQLHGGVGFTWEFDPHLYLRRAQASSQRLGTPAWWLEQVAEQLLDTPEETV